MLWGKQRKSTSSELNQEFNIPVKNRVITLSTNTKGKKKQSAILIQKKELCIRENTSTFCVFDESLTVDFN